MDLYGGRVRLLRTGDRFHSGGLISLGRHDFSKLLDILLMTLLAAKPVQAMAKT